MSHIAAPTLVMYDPPCVVGRYIVAKCDVGIVSRIAAAGGFQQSVYRVSARVGLVVGK